MKKIKQTEGKKPIARSRAAVVLSVASVVLLALTALGTFLFWENLSDPEKVRAAIGQHYLLGALVLILLSAVQVVVALIPGELVEFAAGYVFGPWWSSLFCLIGLALGSVTVIFLVRRFGAKFVYALYPKEKIEHLPILRDPKKRNVLVLILFLIPGTPKDLLTYGIGLTDMSIPVYLMLTTAARFPSVITSTLGGAAVGDRSLKNAIIIYAITAVVSFAGLLLYNWISKKQGKKQE